MTGLKMALITKPEVDVVVVGLGWAGSLMSIELAMAGLTVRALERGGDRGYEEFAYPKPADEYAYAVRNKVMATPAQAAVTVRYNIAKPRCRPVNGARLRRVRASAVPVCTGPRC